MLDVHPPHESVHTWRDFLIHIATITVGLLIAVGLEQTVEAIHRHRERQELRESLHRESERIVQDCERVEPAITGTLEWNANFAGLLLQASREHQPIGKVPPYPNFDFDVPSDPVYLAAKSSNQLDLLTQQEVQAYGEMDGALETNLVAYRQRREALDSVSKTFAALPLSTPGLAPDLGLTSHTASGLEGVTLDPAVLEELYKGAISVEVSSSAFRYWSRQVRGAAVSLDGGERDLRKIQAAERQFDKLP